MTGSGRIVAALILGLALGTLLPHLPINAPERLVALAEPVGALWLNALRMTVLPLVVALLIVGIGTSAQKARAGSLTLRAMGWFAGLLLAAALLGAALTSLLLSVWPVAASSAAALRAGAGGTAASLPTLPSLQDWLVGIVPANPFEAASNGAMLPLVVFATLFGLAAARIDPARRDRLLVFFQAVADTLLMIVRGVLRVAPLGVFALAIGVGQRGGLGAAGAIGHYLVLTCGLSVVVTLLVYPLAVLRGGLDLRDFARAAIPAQAVAISTQSSLASLPAMLTGLASLPGRERASVAVVLPLAVSLFRITSPLVNIGIVLFVAHVNGVVVGAGALVAGIVLAVVTSWSVAGLPSQITFFNTTVPISLAMGVPLQLLPLLLAVEVIPDLFRTVGNVTADMAATAVVTRERTC